jgi:hypothetical protein
MLEADMSQRSLPALVAVYQRTYGPRLAAYLDYFAKLASLDDAIRFACHGKDGQIHGHQHLVGKQKLERARKAIQRHADEIKACKSFDELVTLVEDCTAHIYRFGILAVYDTTLRLGAFLGLWPEVVYLHAGTKKGCKALGVAAKGGKVKLSVLPLPIRTMEPYQAEDFLCIFKDEFGGTDAAAKACGRMRRGTCQMM